MLSGLIFVFAGVYSSLKAYQTIAVYVLLFVGFMFIGSGFATIDPYLHEWDEQYHALVARNLSNDPFHPKLLAHAPVKLDYRIWAYNETWLHKQPLFLWQIALSIKTFGATIWAVRFPSVLLHALTALLVYAIGKRFLTNTLALAAGILFGCSGYYNNYVSGAIGMDHNDVAFVFYVTASFWAWLKYRESTTPNKWVVLIGVLAGCAVLCKWLAGLLIFSGWGMVILAENPRMLKNWLELAKAFAVTVVIALPWQLYCLLNYPVEYAHEMAYNSKHFFEVIEQHSGDALFYWTLLTPAFGSGEMIRWLIMTGLLLFIVKSYKAKGNWLFAITVFVVTYAFFTLAATKLEGYVTIVSSVGFILLLYPIGCLFRLIQTRKDFRLNALSQTLLLLVVLFFHFSPKGVVDRHGFKNPDSRVRLHELHQSLGIIRSAGNCNGYFALKGNRSNILPSLIYLTGKKILTEETILQGTCEHYCIIDLEREPPKASPQPTITPTFPNSGISR